MGMLYLKFLSYIFYSCIMRKGSAHGVERTTSKSQFSPSATWVLRIKSKFAKLGSKRLFPLSHIPCPIFLIVDVW